MISPQHSPAIVFRSPSKHELRKCALVLEAAGINFRTLHTVGEFMIAVAEVDEARSLEELAAYGRENRDTPTPITSVSPDYGGWEGVMGYISVMLLVAILAREQSFGRDWLAAGKMHAASIRSGEWWRAVTALTLHADVLHLVANLAIGGVFGLFAGRVLGSGLAWAGILLAGTGGNLLNALIRHGEHTSIGASTAVFGALGILAAHGWTTRPTDNVSALKRWAPLIGGVILLGFLGTGGARTDVGAHAMGFFSGVFLGAVLGMLGKRALFGMLGQFILGVGAVAGLALSWALALR